MQNKLEEILRSLIGNSPKQSVKTYSKPKQFALKTLDAFDALAQKNAKTNWTQSIWNSLKWYVKNRIIPSKTDEEIRTDLKLIHDTLNPLFDTIKTAKIIQESRKLNDVDSKQQKFVEEIPDFKDALEIIEEL